MLAHSLWLERHICNGGIARQKAGPIPPRYEKIFAATDILMRGLAQVGVVALVDEATGCQEIRDRQALQKILDRYITDEWAKWTKIFPDEFYQELFRLKGLEYPAPGGRKRVVRNTEADVDDTTIARQPTLLAAIKLCIQTAGLQDNQVAAELSIQEAQFSRCMSGRAHFPPNQLDALMDLCGNEVPLRWLALKRGYGLVRLKSAVEEELERERAKTAELELKVEHLAEFLSMAKGKG